MKCIKELQHTLTQNTHTHTHSVAFCINLIPTQAMPVQKQPILKLSGQMQTLTYTLYMHTYKYQTRMHPTGPLRIHLRYIQAITTKIVYGLFVVSLHYPLAHAHLPITPLSHLVALQFFIMATISMNNFHLLHNCTLPRLSCTYKQHNASLLQTVLMVLLLSHYT